MPLLLSVILIVCLCTQPVRFFALLDWLRFPEWLVVLGSTVLMALDFHELAILIAEVDFDLMFIWIETLIPAF